MRRVCVCACVRVCVRACVRVCVCDVCSHYDSVVFRELGVSAAFFLAQRSRCCDPFGNLGCGGGGRHESSASGWYKPAEEVVHNQHS